MKNSFISILGVLFFVFISSCQQRTTDSAKEIEAIKTLLKKKLQVGVVVTSKNILIAGTFNLTVKLLFH